MRSGKIGPKKALDSIQALETAAVCGRALSYWSSALYSARVKVGPEKSFTKGSLVLLRMCVYCGNIFGIASATSIQTFETAAVCGRALSCLNSLLSKVHLAKVGPQNSFTKGSLVLLRMCLS